MYIATQRGKIKGEMFISEQVYLSLQENSLDSLLHNHHGFDRISLVLISIEMSSLYILDRRIVWR